MNPELQRNLWLNLTPGRLVGMPVILGMIFFAAGAVLPGSWLDAVRPVAEWLFYAIVVVWGTWAAARAVVGEIRERTWDGQRLSSIGPWTMLWGKLFGSTVFVWYGGAICLGVILLHALKDQGMTGMLAELAYFVSISLFAHAVTLLASLLGVRRRSDHPRLEVFFYQASGLIAAIFAERLWTKIRLGEMGGTTAWFGYDVATSEFFLASLVIFVLWSVIGCYRLFRSELQMRGGPLVWLAFLIFMIAYAAGFADQTGLTGSDLVVARLISGVAMAAALTYIMAFAELKDWVRYRRVVAHFMSARLLSALTGMQSWMYGFIAVLVLSFWVLAVTGGEKGVVVYGQRLADPAAFALAATAFLARDLGLILFFNTGRNQRRGDFAALVVLFVLYAVIPAILTGTGNTRLMPVFVAFWPSGGWERIIWPLVEAAGVWLVMALRAGASGKLRTARA